MPQSHLQEFAAGKSHALAALIPEVAMVETLTTSTITARHNDDGFDGSTATMVRTVDLRYQGQRTELTVEANVGGFDDASLADLVHDFHQTYNGNFGYDYEGQQRTEIVNIRVTGIVPMEHLSAAGQIAEGTAEPFTTRSAYFGDAGWIDTPIYDRQSLGAGMVIQGPAVIEQYDSTTVILPGHTATVDGTGCLVIRLPE